MRNQKLPSKEENRIKMKQNLQSSNIIIKKIPCFGVLINV